MRATVDTHIRFRVEELDSLTLERILRYLTIVNPAKARAESELVWNAQELPDTISLYEVVNDEWILPRGFIHEFEHIVGPIEWDRRMCSSVTTVEKWMIDRSPPLRDYQHRALAALMEYKNGIYKAPTGSGKTRVMLELISLFDQKSIVIIEKKDLLHQWKRAAEQLGFDSIGVIGGGKWEDSKRLVLATRQSLISRPINDDWFKMFGLVVVDECHHVSSQTMWDIVQRFPAFYRYGCSATPDSDPASYPIAKAVLGPIVHDTTHDDADDALVKPSVKVVSTQFSFDNYHPTERIWDKKENKYKVRRNNYGEMMDKLEADETRNKLIGHYIMEEANNGHHCLVLSKRKNHLRYLHMAFSIQRRDRYMHVFTYTGDNSGIPHIEESIQHIQECDEPCVIFSTLAEEGTDIPILDRLFLAYPGRKLRGFEQAIGRIMRKHPLKQDAVIYDFRDPDVSLLRSQYRDRSQMIYGKRGYEIQLLDT